jgi:hypothetical protein
MHTSSLRRPVAGWTHGSGLLPAARAAAVGGVVAYNWWVVVPFVPGLMPSVNGFFSDLEATGRPHSGLMADADLTAGLLMIAALILRGAAGPRGVRREWKWMVAFAAAGAIGGRYTYACSEGLSATCRAMEWHLQLPLHHYIHVVAGVAEFAFLTTAALLAMRRTRGDGTGFARVYSAVVVTLVAGYPLLGLSYLTDRLGTLVEPIFFIAFSVMFLAEILEPAVDSGSPATWADRVRARVERDDRSGAAVPARSSVTSLSESRT